jgi:hypothetical protein
LASGVTSLFFCWSLECNFLTELTC